MSQELSSVLPVRLPRRKLDSDAVAVCRKLQSEGYTTFLVGGCVRDIILGRAPKDFDIGTSATPNQVKRLFRNCRLIGRRFRLAHLQYSGKILEVATFRGDVADAEDGEEPDDLMIRRANNFGTPEQDALRRDFTVNGLFYDPIAERVIDHVTGYSDIRRRVMRTIGPPDIRFQEDPVRILRAVKFASRLKFSVEPETWEAMCNVAEDIQKCPIARVSEEIYRIAESGHVLSAFDIMDRCGVLPVILPEIAEHMELDKGGYKRHLQAFDRLVRAHGKMPREFVLTALYYPLACRMLAEQGAAAGPGWGAAVEEWFRPIGVRSHIAVKHRTRMRTLCGLMGRAMLAPGKRKRRLGGNDRKILPQALTLMRLHHAVNGGMEVIYERWRALAEEEDLPWVPVSQPAGSAPEEDLEAPRRKRRRRRRRRPEEGIDDG